MDASGAATATAATITKTKATLLTAAAATRTLKATTITEKTTKSNCMMSAQMDAVAPDAANASEKQQQKQQASEEDDEAEAETEAKADAEAEKRKLQPTEAAVGKCDADADDADDDEDDDDNDDDDGDDGDEVKSNIPYYDDTDAPMSSTTMCTKNTSSSGKNNNNNNNNDINFDTRTEHLTLDSDYSPWAAANDDDNDEHFMDDNASVLSSDYGSLYAPKESARNYYQTSMPTSPSPGMATQTLMSAAGGIGVASYSMDVKYTPPNMQAADMILRPPLNSSYHFNYPSQPSPTYSHTIAHHKLQQQQQQQAQQQQQQQAQPQSLPHTSRQTHSHTQQQQRQLQLIGHSRGSHPGPSAMLGFAQHSGGGHHPHSLLHSQHPHHSQHQHQHHQHHGAVSMQHTTHTPTPPPPAGFYPNMWYPNSPYGSSSSGGALSPGSAGSPVSSYSYGPPHRYSPYNAAYHHGHQSHPHASHPHDTMMEMFQLSNSGREARNRAEKNRRDKLNGSIQELSTMVPHVAESPRRVDKTAVLRFAAHGLRLNYVFGKSLDQQSPQITDTLMSMLDSFFLTLTCHGQILLISTSIEQHLGHCQADLYGQNILHITHPEDQNLLKQQLIPTDLENLFDVQATPADEADEPRQRSTAEEAYINRKLREDRRSFRVRLARAGPRSEPTAYEVVKIDGCFRRSDEAPRGIKSGTSTSSSLQLIRRTRGRDDAIPLHTISGNDIVLTACARIIRPPKIVNRLFDANTLEYKTRHLIDGRIIDCDQRIGLVAGYMTDEVRNLSPFTFMHNDDVRWVIVALRQMYDCNSSYGESTYRLFTRNGNIIYLQSKGYLEIDKETNEVHSFVCVNTLLDEEEGKRRVQEMKRKFSVIINRKIPQSTIDVPASQNPQQLEEAVLRLIQNLQKQEGSDDDDDADDDDDDASDDNDNDDSAGAEAVAAAIEDDPKQLENQELVHYAGSQPNYAAPARAQHRQHHNEQQQHQQHHAQQQHPAQQQHTHQQHQQHRQHIGNMANARMSATSSYVTASSKTPPLALVPPEASSVRSSISKSVSVVNVTAAKHLRGMQQQHQQQKSPTPPTADGAIANADVHDVGATTSAAMAEGCSCHTAKHGGDCDYCHSPLTPEAAATTVLKRSNIELPANDDAKLPKRRLMSTEIEQVLTSSLDQIGRTLNQQLSAAIDLRDQGNKFEVPNTSQRIDELMEEHQKQSELFVNIKSEYEVQIQNKSATASLSSESN